MTEGRTSGQGLVEALRHRRERAERELLVATARLRELEEAFRGASAEEARVKAEQAALDARRAPGELPALPHFLEACGCSRLALHDVRAVLEAADAERTVGRAVLEQARGSLALAAGRARAFERLHSRRRRCPAEDADE